MSEPLEGQGPVPFIFESVLIDAQNMVWGLMVDRDSVEFLLC